VKIRLIYFKTFVNKPRKCCFQHTLFQRDLHLWPFDPKLWSVHLCPIMHCWCNFGENVSNTLQDIMSTVFRDAHTDGRTDAQTNMTKPLCLRPHYVGRRHKNRYNMAKLLVKTNWVLFFWDTVYTFLFKLLKMLILFIRIYSQPQCFQLIPLS